MRPAHYIFLLALLVATLQGNAQAPDDTIQAKSFNKGLVQKLFLDELNTMRAKAGLPLLNTDAVLMYAATDQANYCLANSRVTHDQPDNPKKASPKQRVHTYGGNHPIVGENCLMTVVGKPMRDEKTQTNIVVYTYEQLARRLIAQWKNSPPHYKNMMQKVYTNTALALALYDNGNVLYATQVFASKPYVPIKNGLPYSDTTYGVVEYDPAKCKGYGDNEFLTTIFSSYLVLKEDSVFQYFMYEDRMKELFPGAKDGIAIDLMYKNQFICLQPDKLHPSTVFDGYMLPPVYRDALFKNDIYPNGEFQSFVGKLPPGSMTEDLQLNTILIQNGSVCRYSYPVSIEDGILPDLAISPQWVKAEGILKKGSVNFTKTFNIPFDKNAKSADKYYFDKLKYLLDIFDGVITKVEITAYSSVEGSESKNIELQNSRTVFLENYIRGCVKQNLNIDKQAKENWELFYTQLNGSAYKALFADTTKEGLRGEVNRRMDEPVIEDWLNAQRVAQITIYVKKDYDNNIPSQYLPLALYDGINKSDIEQAKIAYTRLIAAYMKGDINKHYLTAIEVPLEKQNLPLISNYLASILIESDVFDYRNFSMDYYKYIDSARILFSSYKPLAFNLAVYKAHLYFRGMRYNVGEFKALEAEIMKFANDSLVDKDVQGHLAYNYYLTGSIFYRHQRMYADMYHCFDRVKPYLSIASLNRKEVYDVGKYFNYFFRFSETIDLLETYLEKYPTDEDLVYLYVSTGMLYNLNAHYNEDYLYKQVEKLSAINRSRLCRWVNENYQVIRNEEIEKKVCKYCTLQY
jgi:uncharacterized protein YkwD